MRSRKCSKTLQTVISSVGLLSIPGLATLLASWPKVVQTSFFQTCSGKSFSERECVTPCGCSLHTRQIDTDLKKYVAGDSESNSPMHQGKCRPSDVHCNAPPQKKKLDSSSTGSNAQPNSNHRSSPVQLLHKYALQYACLGSVHGSLNHQGS